MERIYTERLDGYPLLIGFILSILLAFVVPGLIEHACHILQSKLTAPVTEPVTYQFGASFRTPSITIIHEQKKPAKGKIKPKKKASPDVRKG